MSIISLTVLRRIEVIEAGSTSAHFFSSFRIPFAPTSAYWCSPRHLYRSGHMRLTSFVYSCNCISHATGLVPMTDWLPCFSYLPPSLYVHNLFIVYLKSSEASRYIYRRSVVRLLRPKEACERDESAYDGYGMLLWNASPVIGVFWCGFLVPITL
ncbi:hypothetical protein EV421DRAFT_1435647 [Armillaria borealis]|uniref:Uncharacterized protein n=1 Tax=Armillaria borealis TaxID=47425 RepID=A0AA39IZD9_9AGAR|nr:hypothetical protein EV421DRAFT_1435647 [Armillaria borealis]